MEKPYNKSNRQCYYNLTALAFFRISCLAGWLLVPYLAWVSFAAVLNAEIVLLNP